MGRAKTNKQSTKHSVHELIKKGSDLVDKCKPELAVKFFEKANTRQPNNCSILDNMGELYMELNQLENAFKSIQLQPEKNPMKWLHLSQLVSGQDSVKYVEQAIKIMLLELSALESNQPKGQDNIIVRKQLCEAYCTISELYCTDLCDDDNAERNAEDNLHEAMKYDVGLPDLPIAFANLRMNQNRREDACGLLDEAYNRLSQCDEMNLPSIDFRIMTGKLLFEVEKYEECADVLEGVLQEDDENAEILYIVAKCYLALDDLEPCQELLEQCLQLLSMLKKELREEFHLDDKIEEVNSLILSIRKSLETQRNEATDEVMNDA